MNLFNSFLYLPKAICIVVICLFASIYLHAQTVQPITNDVKVGEKLIFKVIPENDASPAIAVDNVSFELPNEFVKSPTYTTEGNGVRCEIIAAKPIASGEITINIGDATANLPIKISARFNEADFVLDPKLKNPIKISKAKTTVYSIFLSSGETITPGKLKAISSSSDITTSIGDNKLIITAIVPNPSISIQLESDGVNIGTPIQIAVIDTIDTINISKDEIELIRCDENIRNLLKTAGKDNRCSITISEILGTITNSDGASFNEDDLEIKPVDASTIKYNTQTKIVEPIAIGSTRLIIRPQNKDSSSQPKYIKIEVVPTAYSIAINASKSKLGLNQTVALDSIVRDAEGKQITDNRILSKIRWEIVNASNNKIDSQFVTFNTLPNGNIRTTLVQKQGTDDDKIVRFRATYYEAGVATKSVIKILLTQDDFVITEFKPLKVELKVLDTRTAKDFFGHVTSKEYFVVEVRLFNTLTKDSNFVGDSILVYGSSFEAMVSFEYRVRGTKNWINAKEVGNKGDTFTNADKTSPQKNITPAAKLRYAEGLVIPQRKLHPSISLCKAYVPQQHFILPYRPLEFETAVNTHDRRDGRNKRNIALKILNGVGTLTSIVTSVALPGAGSDLPLGLDKFNNLLIPGFEKFFPSIREIHRQNIINKAMLPFEEIPFGGEVVKYLFFPKGMIRGYAASNNAEPVDVKITGINGSDSCAIVAVIKKIEQ